MRGCLGCVWCVFVSDTAQVELRSGRVSAPIRRTVLLQRRPVQHNPSGVVNVVQASLDSPRRDRIHAGKAVQLDPIKHNLKSPGSKRLKLKCDGTAFRCCFQFQLAPLHDGVAQVFAGAHAVHPDSADRHVQFPLSSRPHLCAVPGRGLHSSTFLLNVSTFYWIRFARGFPPVYWTGGHREVRPKRLRLS